MIGLLVLEVKWVLIDPKCSSNGKGAGDPPGQANLPPKTSALRRMREADGSPVRPPASGLPIA